MKRLKDESEGSTVDGLIVDDGGGASVPSATGSAAFPIVGVGASAGGLDAFTQLLKHLPADSGMAFVLIQHLVPRTRSARPRTAPPSSPTTSTSSPPTRTSQSTAAG